MKKAKILKHLKYLKIQISKFLNLYNLFQKSQKSMNLLLFLTLSLCFLPYWAMQTSSFLSENQYTTNISIVNISVEDLKVSYSNITGLSNFLVSCSSVPSQVVIATASQNDVYMELDMMKYFNISKILEELGEDSLYIDYRYYRVYARASNSGSSLNVSVDLPTKHSSQEHITAIAWCMNSGKQSSGYSIYPYGPFNNGGEKLTLKVIYSVPLRAHEVKLQTNLLASYMNLSFYTVYDHFGSRLYPSSNEEEVFYIPDSNQYNTYIDNDFFTVQDNTYSRLANALETTNINQTLAEFNAMLRKQNFLPVALEMSLIKSSTAIAPNLNISKIESTSNSISVSLRALGPGKYVSYLTTVDGFSETSWLSLWNGEDSYGNLLSNFKKSECQYTEDYQILNYGGLNPGTEYIFEYITTQPGPINRTDFNIGWKRISTTSNEASFLGAQIILLFLIIHCLIN